MHAQSDWTARRKKLSKLVHKKFRNTHTHTCKPKQNQRHDYLDLRLHLHFHTLDNETFPNECTYFFGLSCPSPWQTYRTSFTSLCYCLDDFNGVQQRKNWWFDWPKLVCVYVFTVLIFLCVCSTNFSTRDRTNCFLGIFLASSFNNGDLIWYLYTVPC